MEKKKRKTRKYDSPTAEPVAHRVREATTSPRAPSPGLGIRRATLFMNGRSQAVRLPKEFRFSGDHVLAMRDGDRIVLMPHDDRMERLLSIYGSVPDFPDRDQGELQVRPEIDELFR